MKTFTTSDITKIFGLKIDRQKDWLIRGFIAPSIQKATGTGTKNLFSIEDLYQIAMFKALLRATSRKNASAISNKVKKLGEWERSHKTVPVCEGVEIAVYPIVFKLAVDKSIARRGREGA